MQASKSGLGPHASPRPAASAPELTEANGVGSGCSADTGSGPARLDWAALLLDRDGTVCGGEGGVGNLFGCDADALRQTPVSQLLPELGDSSFIKDGRFSPQFRFRCRIGCTFTVRPRNGTSFAAALFPSGVGDLGSPTLRLIVRPVPGESEHA